MNLLSNKTYTACIFSTGILFLISCDKKVEKSNKNINDFVSSCVGEAKKSYSSILSEKDIFDYCNCAADKALDEFTTKDLSKLNNLDKHPDIQNRMAKAIEPCVEELSVNKNKIEKQVK